MSEPTCPSASKLQEILRNTSEFSPDQLTNNFDDMIASFRSQGVDIENCDRAQVLGVVRDFFANLSDDDLAAASGGEVVKSVAIAAAAVGAVAVVGGGIASVAVVPVLLTGR
jgi:hypothetical protein